MIISSLCPPFYFSGVLFKMLSDYCRLLFGSFRFFLPYLFTVLLRRVNALYHRYTWRETTNVKNVVVLGGSFAGVELVDRLVHSLPTGFRVIWVEKNSHFNYSFVFPRFSVIRGFQNAAFIPYDGMFPKVLPGILTRIQDRVIKVTNSEIILESGRSIDYTYLAIATGSTSPAPGQVLAIECGDACAEMLETQKSIHESQNIAIVGGGALGVELAADIKTFFPSKDVTLIHSRSELMNKFGQRLRALVLHTLSAELRIRVLLNERPQLPERRAISRSCYLTFSDKREESFDLVVSLQCTYFCLSFAFVNRAVRYAARDKDQILPCSNLSFQA